MEAILFYILATIAVITAIAAITRVSPLMSAIWLVVCLISIAGIFALLSSPLLAVLQVLIAAGAVMVLFLFVIMLTNLGPDGRRQRVISFAKILGAVATAYMAAVLLLAAVRPPFTDAPASGDFFEGTLTLSKLLLDRYALPFELAGVLLLVAVVGAIVVGKKLESHCEEPKATKQSHESI